MGKIRKTRPTHVDSWMKGNLLHAPKTPIRTHMKPYKPKMDPHQPMKGPKTPERDLHQPRKGLKVLKVQKVYNDYFQHQPKKGPKVLKMNPQQPKKGPKVLKGLHYFHDYFQENPIAYQKFKNNTNLAHNKYPTILNIKRKMSKTVKKPKVQGFFQIKS